MLIRLAYIQHHVRDLRVHQGGRTRCRAHPLTGDKFFIDHSTSPRAKELKAAAVKKGGKARTRPEVVTSWEYRMIESTDDLKTLGYELVRRSGNNPLIDREAKQNSRPSRSTGRSTP